MNFDWSFGQVIGGVSFGFRDSGMHLFGNSAFESMVREGIQNSIDAHDPSVGEPVHVAFTLDDFDPQIRRELAGLEKFMRAGEAIEKSVANGASSDATGWYKRSIANVATASKVAVLGLHDANTLGLSGRADDSAESAGPWIALVRGQGINAKRSGNALGGFGHGSNAAFGMSDLRTVFYLSPSTDESGNPVTRFQGHAVLQTLNIDGKKTNRDGFYGRNVDGDISPVYGDEVPDWFAEVRARAVGDGLGTSTFIFDPKKAGVNDFWPALKICVIANYAYAILKGRLTVRLGNDERIDAGNIVEVFGDLLAGPTIEELGLSDGIGASLESAKTVLFPSDSGLQAVKEFGQYEWFLRLGDDVTESAVGVARDPGMLITRDAIKLQAFGGYTPFDLFVCVRSGSVNEVTGVNNGGAVVIKSMEDPSHTRLSFDWAAENRRDDVRLRYLRFSKDVRDLVRAKAIPVLKDVIDIDIDELFGDDPMGDDLVAEGLVKVIVRQGKKKRPAYTRIGPGIDVAVAASPPVGDGGNGLPGGKGGTPPENPHGNMQAIGGSEKGSPLRKLRLVRVSVDPTGDWSQVRVVLEADRGGKRAIRLMISGESYSRHIEARVNLDSPATLDPIEVQGEATGRAEAMIWVPTHALNYALSGEIHYGL